MPIAKRSQVAESLQSVCPDLRVSINATDEASFYTLPNNRHAPSAADQDNENLSQPPATAVRAFTPFTAPRPPLPK